MESTTKPVFSRKKALDAIGMLEAQSDGVHLIDEARKVMRSLGHDTLDPVHIIAGALNDVFLTPVSVKMLLRQNRISDYESARGAAQSALQAENELYSDFAYVMFSDLFDLRQAYLRKYYIPSAEFNHKWSWYGEVVKLALKSQSPAVLKLIAEQ